MRQSVLFIFVLTFLSRVAGFGRTVLLAALFGTSRATDAFVMASSLPNLLFGAISQSVGISTVPLLIEARTQHGQAGQQDFINQVSTLVLGCAMLVVMAGEWMSPTIVHWMAPGFHGTEQRLTVLMTRVMIPSIIFWGASGLLTGVLQAQENFAGLSWSPLLVNIVQIGVMLSLYRHLHIMAAAWASTLAVASQLLILMPLLRQRGFKLGFSLNLRHARLHSLAKMILPYFLASSAANIEVMTDRVLASSLPAGSISAMNFALTVSQVPLGLIIAPVAAPIFSRLAQHHAEHRRTEFSQLALYGIRWLTLLVLPATAVLVILHAPLLRAIYEHGRFGHRSFTLTAHIFLCAISALPAQALTAYLQQVSYAAQNSKRPARSSLIAITVNIVGNIVLVRWAGVYGLVLATSLASWVNLALLLIPSYARSAWRAQRPFLASVALALATMSLVLISLAGLTHLDRARPLCPLVLWTGIDGWTALCAYELALVALEVPEASHIARYIMHHVRLRAITGKIRHQP
jgi:putative peptidoglycan lipid II flippase